MRQITFTLEDFIPGSESTIPDAVLSPDDLRNLKVLAGINKLNYATLPVVEGQPNMTHTAMERVNYMKEHDIRPGTDEWFRLWFSRPYLTGDSGMDK